MGGRLRSVVAVLVGFMAMMVLLSIANAVAILRFPAQVPATTGPLVFRVVSALVAALLAGLLTGWIAGYRRVRHGYALGAVVLLLTLLSILRYGGGRITWYQVLTVAGAPAFAILGAWAAEGLHRLHQRGAALRAVQGSAKISRKAGPGPRPSGRPARRRR